MDRESKNVLELKKSLRVIQQNINRLYGICSAIYQEIQDIKHFVNYKHDDNLGEVESTHTNISMGQKNMQDSMNILDNVEEFAETMPKGRRLRIINN